MRLSTPSSSVRALALRFCLAAATTPLLYAGAASATTVVRLDLAALAAAAEQVVSGRVEAVEPYRDRGRIYTRVTLAVAETLKGPGGPQSHVSFSVHGGELDGIGQFVAGQARFEVGETVLVFLTDLARRPTLLGLSQGKWSYDARRPGAELSPDRLGLAGLELVGPDGRPVVPAAPTDVGLETLRAALRAGGGR
jgi:hypothetical protein